jgi:hypothetical protein
MELLLIHRLKNVLQTAATLPSHLLFLVAEKTAKSKTKQKSAMSLILLSQTNLKLFKISSAPDQGCQ